MIGRSTAEPVSSRRRAKLRSNRVTCPAGEMWMLPGVTSPCIQPAACRASRASAVCRAIQRASATSNCWPAANRACKRCPFQPRHDQQPRRLEHGGRQHGHQMGVRNALSDQGLALQQTNRLGIVLPARAEHLHGVAWPVDRPPLRPAAPDRFVQGFPRRQTPPTPTVLPDSKALPHSQRAHGAALPIGVSTVWVI